MSRPAITVITSAGSYGTVPGHVLRRRALAILELRDPWTGAAPEQVAVAALTPLTSAHVVAGHLIVTGLPGRALPQLPTTPATLGVRIKRPGRRPQHFAIEIPAAATLPYRTTADLEADPIALVGRVREARFPHDPVPGARLVIAGRPGQDLVALRTPLALNHRADTAIRVRSLSDAGGTTAPVGAAAGSHRITLASAAGIGPGTVLALGAPENLEHVRALATEPGDVVLLRTPLARSVAAGTPIRRCTTGAAGTATTLTRSAQQGDGILLTAAPLTGAIIEIGTADTTEFRALDVISAATGGWRLDGVRGVPAIVLTTSASGLVTSGPIVHPLVAGPAPAVIDIELTV